MSTFFIILRKVFRKREKKLCEGKERSFYFSGNFFFIKSFEEKIFYDEVVRKIRNGEEYFLFFQGSFEECFEEKYWCKKKWENYK